MRALCAAPVGGAQVPPGCWVDPAGVGAAAGVVIAGCVFAGGLGFGRVGCCEGVQGCGQDRAGFGVELAADSQHPVLQREQPKGGQGAQGVFVAFQGPVGPDQGHQGASDGDDVAVVAGLGHLGQRREGFFAFAGGQRVFDLVQLA